MGGRIEDPVSLACRRAVSDLKEDRYLRYILVLAALLMGFWFWWRAPNFSTADEYGRILRPMKAAGYFMADPSLASFRRGATDGLAQGASFNLIGLTLLPTFVLVVLSGNLGSFAEFADIESRWTLWHTVPEWFWWSAILTNRLVAVALAVGTVYLGYRIAQHLYDRRAGRIAALLLALSLGLIASAHEVNEDTPMVFLLLLTLLAALRYRESGDRRAFYVACLLGGATIAFKLTGGVVVVFIGLAYFHRVLGANEPVDLRLLVGGVLTGLATMYVLMPNVLLSGPTELLDYMLVSFTSHATKHAATGTPFGFRFVHSYLRGLGGPLGVAAALCLGFSFVRLRRSLHRPGALLVAAISLYVVVFLQWSNISVHHLLPMNTLLVILSAGPLARFYDRGETNRVLVTVLVIMTAGFAVAGTATYATAPFDQGSDYIRSEIPANSTMVVYENSVADVAIVHGRPVSHYDFVEEVRVENSVANKSAYTEWMVETPKREPDFIQITNGELGYLASDSTNARRFPDRAVYLRRLVDGDHFGYAVDRELGTRPRYDIPYWRQLVTAGIVPDIEKRDPYVLILERPTQETRTS